MQSWSRYQNIKKKLKTLPERQQQGSGPIYFEATRKVMQKSTTYPTQITQGCRPITEHCSLNIHMHKLRIVTDLTFRA